jgi:hypothetical protein
MDYDLSAEQSELLAAVDDAVTAAGGHDHAIDIASRSGYDPALDRQLETIVPIDGAGLLERVLVAEHLAELGVATTFGLRSVLGVDHLLPEGGLTVWDRSRLGPVRYGRRVPNCAVLDASDVTFHTVTTEEVQQRQAGFGYPYSHVEVVQATGPTFPGAADQWRIRHRLALAAEIAGTATTAITRTAEHLRARHQFGRPLSTYQALRHRLADAATSAEATKWLVRQAAFRASPESIDLAAFYAAQTAGQLVPELTQLCGARSFTLAFGLHLFTMRLDGLRLELGGRDRLSSDAIVGVGTAR